ncbi:MAG: hypothetical protein IKM19_05340 [Firmicutes bacterium]|nr:hypothetical protein [Bacillota bacterium]
MSEKTTAKTKNYAFADITGQKFGRITALHPTQRRSKRGHLIWHCQCDCGRELDISYNDLVYTNRKSCGCRKQEHNQELKNILTHIDGTSIDMLRSKKVPADNTTGAKGVYYIRGKYTAKIVFQKKQYHLGSYETFEEAAAVRAEAEKMLFDGAVEYYSKWKERAAAEPEWAAANPVQIKVEKEGLDRLKVRFLPEL